MRWKGIVQGHPGNEVDSVGRNSLRTELQGSSGARAEAATPSAGHRRSAVRRSSAAHHRSARSSRRAASPLHATPFAARPVTRCARCPAREVSLVAPAAGSHRCRAGSRRVPPVIDTRRRGPAGSGNCAGSAARPTPPAAATTVAPVADQRWCLAAAARMSGSGLARPNSRGRTGPGGGFVCEPMLWAGRWKATSRPCDTPACPAAVTRGLTTLPPRRGAPRPRRAGRTRARRRPERRRRRPPPGAAAPRTPFPGPATGARGRSRHGLGRAPARGTGWWSCCRRPARGRSPRAWGAG